MHDTLSPSGERCNRVRAKAQRSQRRQHLIEGHSPLYGSIIMRLAGFWRLERPPSNLNHFSRVIYLLSHR